MAFAELIKNISIMIPGGYTLGPADREERLAYEEECYKNAKKAYVNAQDTLNSNIPFISDDMS